MNLGNLLIIFIDKQKNVVEALTRHFGDLFNVQCYRGDIYQIPKADCVACPGNSYGLLEESIEKSITYMFKEINERIQTVINNIHYGEQPVGTCFMLETHDPNYKYLAHVPTCRFPKDVSETHNAYLAFRALLTGVLNHNKISDNKIYTVVCTPFCTGVGNMDPDEAIRQMRIAYNVIDMGLPCSVENAELIDSTL